MQTTTHRPIHAHGIVVALYRGKVVTWWRGDVAERPALGRPGVPRAGVGS